MYYIDFCGQRKLQSAGGEVGFPWSSKLYISMSLHLLWHGK